MGSFKINKVEISIIFLFIAFCTFVIFIGEMYFYHFSQSQAILKQEINHLLFWSFIKALIINVGFIFLYYSRKIKARSKV